MNIDEFKTTVNKKAYDSKNAKQLLMNITTQKLVKSRQYSDLIKSDIDALEKTNYKGKDRRLNY